ncbi:MAG: GAF domain-containing protein [Candidatus Solibacter usitatus]|nr:GAF domain-containing protein [Candidatus Solibacter usitatus]
MPASNKSRARFKERAELLDFLLEVSTATGETLDLERLLTRVTEIVTKVIPSDLFAILLYNEKLRGLRIVHSVGHRPEIVRNLVISLGEGLTGVAAETRQPVMTGDVRGDTRYLSALDAVRSELAVPMMARGKLVGVIDAQSTTPNAYSDYDSSLLQLIAARVGFAVANARLYHRVVRQNQMMRTLASTGQEFASILALDELLRKIAEILRGLINYDAFSVLLVDEERQVLRHKFSLRYDQRVELDNVPLGSGITGAAAASRESVKVNDTTVDPRYIASHPGVQSEVAVPLIHRGRVVGVLDLESERLGFFTEDHVKTLSLLAPQIVTSLENARLYEEIAAREQRMDQDLRAARKMQKVLLPRTAPAVEGLEIALGARPAREISGDIYDFFERSGGRLLLCFGDSSGKSAAAALYGALVTGLLRSLAASEKRPAELMALLNEAVLERKVETKYVTLMLALWDPSARTFTLTNAGNTLPMVCRKGELIEPHVEGVPVGLLEDREYDEVVFQAQPGDVIALYSDGVQDQLAPCDPCEQPKDYGTKRLGRLLRKNAARPAAQIVGAVFSDLDKFAAGTPITDDQSIIIMRVR